MADSKHLFYLMLTVPALYVLIGIEALYASRKLGKTRTWKAFFMNVNISMGQQVFGAFSTIAIAAFYTRIHSSYRIFELPVNALTLLAGFLLLDLNTYLFHRLSHRVNFLWATHSVHHSSPEFGLSVSIRHAWFAGLLLAIPQYSLAMLGFAPETFFPLITVFYLVQFFVHADSLPRLGWLEWILVTPTHHSVHHAREPQYLDSNYGAALIIWDRLFGTFVEKKEEPTYGLVEHTGIQSALWENIHYLIFIQRSMWKLPTLKLKLTFLLSPPGHVFPAPIQAMLKRLKQETVAFESRLYSWIPTFSPRLQGLCVLAGFVATLGYMAIDHATMRAEALTLGAVILGMIILQPISLPSRKRVERARYSADETFQRAFARTFS